MALNLPPDPYKALGVAKDAKLPEIRSAHRKLVIKCHPDKVQDAALKAEKQDEFHKVQQAYELLSDDTKRLQYDEQVKLFELRKEMGRGIPTQRTNPSEFEVYTAEPRPSTYARPRAAPPPSPKVYSRPPPKSYEDVAYDIPLRTAKKSTSYESTDRKREEERLREARKREEDEIARKQWEKERKRAAHGEKKKSRDKDKRRDAEEKRTRAAYVESDSDEPIPPPSREKKSSRHRMEEEAEAKAAASPRIGHSKWDAHQEIAREYMQAARRKAAPPPEEEEFRPAMHRAQTFAAPMRYDLRTPTTPKAFSPSDDDAPRRSSGHRRSSETPPTRSRDAPKKEKEKRSPSTRKFTSHADIVEPPSPPPILKSPKLKTHSSAPPIIPSGIIPDFLKKPTRSKTEYPSRKEKDVPSPTLNRAQTFQSGDRGRDREGSRLKHNVKYDTETSDSDDPPIIKRGSRSPPRRAQPESTRYVIDNSRAVPVAHSRHRSHELRNIDDDDYSPRDRSESPRDKGSRSKPDRASPRTPASASRSTPQRQASSPYYPPDADPVILNARPKMPTRERGNSKSGSAYYGDVKMDKRYGPEDVHYSPLHSPEMGPGYHGHGHARRGSEQHAHAYGYPSPRGDRSRGEVGAY